jgi:hypothetical protein
LPRKSAPVDCVRFHSRNAENGLEKRIDELLGPLKLRGIKIHPSHQTVFPNDYLNGNESLRYLYSAAKRKESQ